MNYLHYITILLVIFGSHEINAELKWTDLRMTWGLAPTGSAFNQVPRSLRDPIFSQQNWTRISTTCENNGKFNGFQHVIPGDYGTALLFDVNGVIAGVQLLLNKTSILAPGNNVNYPVMPVYQTQTFESTEFFLLTTYLVDPAIICTSGRNDSDLAIEGTGTHVLIQNGTSPSAPLVRIPRNRTVALAEGWSKNQCFMGMGYHNFYGVEQYQSHNCTQVFPFFGLYTEDGEMLGFGSTNSGTVVNHRFENPSSQAISIILGPGNTPKCILDTQNSIGLTAFHVYFIDKPWLLSC